MAVEPTATKNLKTEYEKRHRPASDFKRRSEYLDHELQITNLENKRWGLFLAKKQFRFEWEDLVPAFAGTLGTVALTTGVVVAFTTAYGLPDAFAMENIRLEVFWGALFGATLMAFLHPRTGAAGTHGWMIPLVPAVVAVGGHPLALGIVIGLIGLVLSFLRGGALLQALTPNGVVAGLLILFGFLGAIDQVRALRAWTDGLGIEFLFIVLILISLLIYSYLAKTGARWAAIPICGPVGAIIALAMGAPFTFTTPPAFPNFNPFYWWGADTGWMLGLPTFEHFIAVIPFAVIAIVMWPPDAIGLIAFQRTYYPPNSENAYMHIDDGFRTISLRQLTGSLLGGGQISDPWGTLVIPCAIIKRPLAAAQALCGIFAALVAVSGYLMDLVVFPPVLRMTLLVGVFFPLLEIGMRLLKTTRDTVGAGTCIAAGLFINPIFGWAFATLVESYGLLGSIEPERLKQINEVLSRRMQLVLATVLFIVCVGIMAIVGMLPGVPGIM